MRPRGVVTVVSDGKRIRLCEFCVAFILKNSRRFERLLLFLEAIQINFETDATSSWRKKKVCQS